MAISIKNWAKKMNDLNEQRYQDLKNIVDETQKLFQNEVMNVLKGIKDMNKIK